MNKHFTSLAVALSLCISAFAQEPIPVGSGSYASFAPLEESRTTEHNGSQAYQTDHRHLYIEDSLATRPVPTNDYWTYALVNQWTGNLWAYPAMVKAEKGTITVNYPDYWEPTGCEMKWDKSLVISANDFNPTEAIMSDWSDFSISFVMRDGTKYVKTTLMMGSPLVWMEFHNLTPKFDNASPQSFATFELEQKNVKYLTVGLITENLGAEQMKEYAFRIPTSTQIDYQYDKQQSTLTTSFHVATNNVDNSTSKDIIAGFIPHHYRHSAVGFNFDNAEYQTPRGTLKTAHGNDFKITYDVNPMLPYFPAPEPTLQGYDSERMRYLIADYAQKGSFGADTYWGGKGLVQMAHYMTFAHQIGDTQLFEQTKSRLRNALVDWFTYTPGEKDFYFARYQRFGALVGFDPSYDSDTFNDHHFHYGYFVYSAALLCLFDDDFRVNYGPMAREVALDYACWLRNSTDYPLFRTFNPWLGHSFAGGMGGDNGNGQESTSEAIQSWGGIWMLGAALNDEQMLNAGVFGYTLEAQGTAQYWFDRDRVNIQYDKYQHPYCCNLTSQGVGWWTWFSGDPVWMHSIQWLPISPLLTNYLGQDTAFARWDYTQMYQLKEIGNYEAQTGGLADESGLGNVCLSYLSLFDPDSAARVFDRCWNNNKALAKNPDTGGITYWLTHAHRSLGNKRFDIKANYPLASAYTKGTTTTYAVYNTSNTEQKVTFTLPNGTTQTFTAPANKLTLFNDQPHLASIQFEQITTIVAGATESIHLHFLDQYGATYRPDSIFNYTAPNVDFEHYSLTATYQGLTDTLNFVVCQKPVIKDATVVPQIDYIQYGEQIVFSLSATDQYGQPFPTEWQQVFHATEMGYQQITCNINDGTSDHTFSQSFVVLPPYPNIALGKPAKASSEENGGTLAIYATDGDKSTRWGSVHNDNESIVVDLKSECYVNNIVIYWEAAYASEYKIEISLDSIAWQPYLQTCSGGVVNTDIEANARYIRLTGIQRATQYGISIYELEAYGMDNTISETELLGLLIKSDRQVINAGDKVTFSVHGYNLKGEEIAINPTLAVTTNNATLDGNSLLCPTAGEVTLTATTLGLTTQFTWIVQETEQITSVQISPKEVTLPLGESQTFIVQTLNQFGSSASEQYINYVADQLGDFTVVGESDGLTDTAIVHVVALSNLNLALNKPVTVSGEENAGTTGDKAVDGDTQSRWSSRFQDNEWIEIDLQNIYYINSIYLLWEASYATAYNIEFSIDGSEYYTVYSTTDSKGGIDTIHIDDAIGRYVRLTCVTRSSGYGSSLWEIEIYGSGIYSGVEQPTAETNIDFSKPIEIYNIIGQRIMRGTATIEQLRTLLPNGSYLIMQDDKTQKILF